MLVASGNTAESGKERDRELERRERGKEIHAIMAFSSLLSRRYQGLLS